MHGMSIREAFGEKLDKPISGGLLRVARRCFEAYAPRYGSAKQRACRSHVTRKPARAFPEAGDLRGGEPTLRESDECLRPLGRLPLPDRGRVGKSRPVRSRSICPRATTRERPEGNLARTGRASCRKPISVVDYPPQPPSSQIVIDGRNG